ncbi:MAG: polysaccharide biosynthesis tyrosine autokinase, partial [Actinobacteria bacterium]|nr:polysaccharide biosynthesis tyrosine autokinase [Actinomycetota bacterium]
YEGHARVLIETSPGVFDANGASSAKTASQVDTEIQVIESAPVKSGVRDKLGSTPPAKASVVGTTSVLDIATESISPTEAAKSANAYADVYVDYRRQRAINTLLAATKQLGDKLADLDKQIADANGRAAAAAEAATAAAVAAGAKPGTAPPPATPEQDALQTQRGAFKEKFDQLEIDTAIKSGGAEVVAPATVPKAPVRPTTVRNVLLGLIVGIVVGLGLAFLLDQLDDSLNGKEDVERLVDLPVIAVIPRAPGWRNRTEPLLISQAAPSSPAAEAYRSLRTSIQFFSVDRAMRTLLVTSPTAGEGKTTTISNLAVVLSRAGERVVVVSCDLRRPRLHDFFGIPNTIGFTSVLLGTAPLSSALQAAPDETGLSVIPSGPLPPNPSELLSSRRAAETFSVLQANFDTVLLDCPPVLPVTDAAVLSSRVDGTLIVASARSTTSKQLSRAVGLLRQVNSSVVGVVLNNAAPEEAAGYEYYYYNAEPKVVPTSSNGNSRGAPERSISPLEAADRLGSPGT